MRRWPEEFCWGIDVEDLPEGTEWVDFMTPCSADSPVGKGDVVRILQYEVREGREAEAGRAIEIIDPCRMQGSLRFAGGVL